MAEVQHKRMTPDEFFEWQKNQDRNYELVDGVPVLPLKAMTGATRKHDRAVTNTMYALMRRLDGGPCWPTTDDIAMRIPAGNVRRPDITVECSLAADGRLEVVEPRVIVEVLSPSTAGVDRLRKLEEYKTRPEVQVILLIDTEVIAVAAWRRRAGSGWELESYGDLADEVPLPEIGIALPLAEIYKQIAIRRMPGPDLAPPP